MHMPQAYQCAAPPAGLWGLDMKATRTPLTNTTPDDQAGRLRLQIALRKTQQNAAIIMTRQGGMKGLKMPRMHIPEA